MPSTSMRVTRDRLSSTWSTDKSVKRCAAAAIAAAAAVVVDKSWPQASQSLALFSKFALRHNRLSTADLRPFPRNFMQAMKTSLWKSWLGQSSVDLDSSRRRDLAVCRRGDVGQRAADLVFEYKVVSSVTLVLVRARCIFVDSLRQRMHSAHPVYLIGRCRLRNKDVPL